MKKIICIFLLSFMAGCTSVHFTETLLDQTVKEFSYFNSIFSKEITDFSYTGEGDGVRREVLLGKSKSEASEFIALMREVLESGRTIFESGIKAGKASAGIP